MSKSKLSGVIAAVATAIREDGEPDAARSVELARHLLDNGCDGLNVLGTTGEATSFSVEQRRTLMSAYGKASLPMERLMVGTGTAALADTLALTRHAAELGFAGALVLPPFYYKGISKPGLVDYVSALVEGTAASPIPIYLYNFPAMSGIPWLINVVIHLREKFGSRIAGLKDSSGDLPYAREVAKIPGFAVFPSNEATLMEARSGPFAGCISATANVNADLCARAYRSGDNAAFEAAVAIRKIFDGRPLVASVKATLAYLHADPAWRRMMPPLVSLPASDQADVKAEYDNARRAIEPAALTA